MTRTQDVARQCAIWAFIGTWISLAASVQFDLGWWPAPVGATAFGTFAWVFADPKGFLEAMRKGWREFPDSASRIFVATSVSDTLLATHYGFYVGAIAGMGSMWLGLFVTQATRHTGAPSVQALDWWTICVIALACWFAAWAISSIELLQRDREKGVLPQDELTNLEGVRWAALMVAILPIVFLALTAVLVALYVGEYLQRVARYAASHERDVAAMATGVGVLAGFALGYPERVLVGSLAGGVLAYGACYATLALLPRIANANLDPFAHM